MQVHSLNSQYLNEVMLVFLHTAKENYPMFMGPEIVMHVHFLNQYLNEEGIVHISCAKENSEYQEITLVHSLSQYLKKITLYLWDQ